MDIVLFLIAIGIGVSWGHGVLKYKGKEYKFSMDGLSN